VLVHVKPHSIFDRHGQDVLCEVSIPLTKAILGGEAVVPTLSGSVKMKIPKATQGGKIFRLSSKGLADVHSGRKGDQLVKVNVQIPDNLTKEESRLIEQFAKLRGEEVDEVSSFTDKIKKVFR
jgi:molecular chaperone DnaJ